MAPATPGAPVTPTSTMSNHNGNDNHTLVKTYTAPENHGECVLNKANDRAVVAAMAGTLTTYINTKSALSSFIDDTLGFTPPLLYLSILCKDNDIIDYEHRISLLTLLVADNSITPQVFIIDVLTLGHSAFTTTGNAYSTVSLASVIASATIPKVVFDSRTPAIALILNYRVYPAGIIDLQLLENAARPVGVNKVLLQTLEQCARDPELVPWDLGGPIFKWQDVEAWDRVNSAAQKLFDPSKGGVRDVIRKRPLPFEIAAYCVGRVQWLPALHDLYLRRLVGRPGWMRQRIPMETRNRIFLSACQERPNGAAWHLVCPWAMWGDEVAEMEARPWWDPELMIEESGGNVSVLDDSSLDSDDETITEMGEEVMINGEDTDDEMDRDLMEGATDDETTDEEDCASQYIPDVNSDEEDLDGDAESCGVLVQV